MSWFPYALAGFVGLAVGCSVGFFLATLFQVAHTADDTSFRTRFAKRAGS